MNDCTQLLFDKKGAAEMLSLSVRTIDYMLTNGELESKRVGRKVLIPKSALAKFAARDHPNIKVGKGTQVHSQV